MNTPALILDEQAILQKVKRIAHEIHEQNFQENELILAGVDPTGYKFALMLKEAIEESTSIAVSLVKVSLDKNAPLQSEILLDVEEVTLEGKVVIICDDVLNTGRTLAYSLKPFLNINVKRLQVAVVVDRNYKLFPVSADYVGYALATTIQEHVRVEMDKELAVYLS